MHIDRVEHIQMADLMGNQILSMLPVKERQLLLRLLEPVPLTVGKELYQPDDLIENVYFPTSGVVSLLTSAETDAQMSIAMIGREGIIGLPAFFRISVSGYQAMVTTEGSALKVKTIDFLDICESGGVLPSLLQRYANLTISKQSQMLVCSRFHPIESQLVCWLLMTHDRTLRNELPIRQVTIANLLGMRREAVTLIMGKLQKQQLISYNRGRLTIVNRVGIEAIACACYGIIKLQEESFFG